MDFKYDQELIIQLCKKFNPKAQSIIYKEFRKDLYGYIFNNYTTDNVTDIEEVLNATFHKAFAKFVKYEGTGSLAGWLKAIAKYNILDHIQKKRKYLVDSGDYLLSDGGLYENSRLDNDDKYSYIVASDDTLGDLCEKDYLEVIKKSLTKRECEVFLLYYQGYKHHEIGEKLSICEGTSKWHVSIAREKLQKIIKR
jgi:RNA polymerase sigma factor (sigma-70 family)